MNHIRTQTAEYSRQHPEMPISYAGGYALSTEFEDCDIRELFRHADQNMYIDKNRAKMEEAAAERKISLEALDVVKKKGYHFSNCIYCNARQDQYRILRAVSGFFLAEAAAIPVRPSILCRASRMRKRERKCVECWILPI